MFLDVFFKSAESSRCIINQNQFFFKHQIDKENFNNFTETTQKLMGFIRWRQFYLRIRFKI